MSTVFRPEAHAALLRRLDHLQPDSEARWGRMSAPEAICHLADSFKAILGDRALPRRPVGFRRRLVRFFAFTLPLPWPKGVPTTPEVNPHREGTRPGDFAEDVAELKGLLQRFVERDGELPPHYVWGDLSRGEWGRYAWRHVDHHLRQFGS